MNQNLPATHHPAEVVQISPESLEVANVYLQLQDINKTAEELDIPREIIVNILNKREVKTYIDNVFFNLGFNNRFKLRAALDAVIAKKFQELDEADTGSDKDIADLLHLSHKITMEQLGKEIELEKLKQGSIKTQTNIQLNGDTGSNYSNLLKKLLNPDTDPNDIV